MGGWIVAISKLECIREGSTLSVVWSWDVQEKTALITITRLLDGEELYRMNVGQTLYREAINSPYKGPVFRNVPSVPLRVTVEDSGGMETVDLVDFHYTVKWQIIRHTVYQKRWPFPPKPLETEVSLQLWFPCEGRVPDDIFYYSLPGQGRKPGKTDPVGYLPALRPGHNVYGVIVPVGRDIILCCNARHEAVSRLFRLERLPDMEM